MGFELAFFWAAAKHFSQCTTDTHSILPDQVYLISPNSLDEMLNLVY